MERRPQNWLKSAIEKAGGAAELARQLGINRSAIIQWKAKGVVPAPLPSDERNKILEIERITGVHRHYLNPLIYPEAP